MVFTGQASMKDAPINRGEHREVLAVCPLARNMTLVVLQDKIEVIEQLVNSAMINDENNLPQGRTVIQYEREKK